MEAFIFFTGTTTGLHGEPLDDVGGLKKVEEEAALLVMEQEEVAAEGSLSPSEGGEEEASLKNTE